MLYISDIKIHSIFSYSYHEASCFKNYSIDTNELIFFLNGQGETLIDGKEFKYSQNSLCFTKPFAKKSNKCNIKTNYICVRFYANMDNFSLENGIFVCNDNEILHLFLEIQKEYSLKKTNYFEICNIKINELIIKIERNLKVENSNEKIYQLIQRLDKDKIFNISIKEMAKELSYSYDRFRHIFKEVTGKSPTDYIINKRVEHACELLNDSKYSCTEISQICGFSSSAQFSYIFKRKIGISPKKFRK